MSLATRCPACGTIFRVVQDQLKVSEGWVRCGQCHEVFHGIEALFDLDSDPAVAARRAAGAPPDAPATVGGANAAAAPPPARAFAAARANEQLPPPAPVASQPPAPLPPTPAAASRPAAPGAAPATGTPAPARPANTAARPPSFAPSTMAGFAPATSPAPLDPTPPAPQRSGIAPRFAARLAEEAARAQSGSGSGSGSAPIPSAFQDSRPAPFGSSLPQRLESGWGALPEPPAVPPADKPPAMRASTADAAPTTAQARVPAPQSVPAAAAVPVAEPIAEPPEAPPAPPQADAAELAESFAAPPVRQPRTISPRGAPAPTPAPTVAAPSAASAAAPAPAPTASTAAPTPAVPATHLPAKTGAAPASASATRPAALAGAELRREIHAAITPAAEAKARTKSASDKKEADEDARAGPPTLASMLPEDAGEWPPRKSRKNRTPKAATSAERRKDPRFLREAKSGERWSRPWVRAVLSVLVVALAATAAGQLAWPQREALAARWPATLPAWSWACAQVDCSIGAPRAIASLALDGSSLTRTETAHVLLFSADLHNRADHEVRMPSFDLTFMDLNGQVVARKVLSPEQIGIRQNALAGEGELHVHARIQVGDLDASGFQAEMFYP